MTSSHSFHSAKNEDCFTPFNFVSLTFHVNTSCKQLNEDFLLSNAEKKNSKIFKDSASRIQAVNVIEPGKNPSSMGNCGSQISHVKVRQAFAEQSKIIPWSLRSANTINC